MKSNAFYKHVSSWIDSYYNAEALEWLRRFINASAQPQDVKDRLHLEVDRKVASLTGAPFFGKWQGECYLLDEHGHPQVFTTRYAAVAKILELRQLGHDVDLVQGTFYRIKINQPLPVMVG